MTYCELSGNINLTSLLYNISNTMFFSGKWNTPVP